MLRKPPASDNGKFIEQLLTKAYQTIGYDIEWLEVTSARELKLAETNQLAGVLARIAEIENSYPSLKRVNHPILSFQVLKVSDRTRCGQCTNSDINSVSFTKGILIAEQYAQQQLGHAKHFPITTPQKLNTIIGKQRVDSVLLMDFQLEQQLNNRPELIIEVVAQELDYHYLAPKYAHLAKPLAQALKTITNNNKLITLKKVSK